MGELTEAASGGDRVATLIALRDRLAREIESAETARDVASLAPQLTRVLAEIAELAPPAAKVGTPLDELAARRAPGNAAAKPSRRATKPRN